MPPARTSEPGDTMHRFAPNLKSPVAAVLFLAAPILGGCTALNPTGDGEALPPIDLAEWASETIILPPEFAPQLPAGVERLLFAPGMWEPAADDFWSYAFAMRVEPIALGVDELDLLLERYYDGLIGAVASGKNASIDSNPANVEVERRGPGQFFARISLIDTFVTMRGLNLNLLLDAEQVDGATVLRVKASPQPLAHPTWLALEAALQSIEV